MLQEGLKVPTGVFELRRKFEDGYLFRASGDVVTSNELALLARLAKERYRSCRNDWGWG